VVVNLSVFFSLSQFIVKNDRKMKIRHLRSGQRLKKANGIEKGENGSFPWFLNFLFRSLNFPVTFEMI